jgi:hypothetical protein
VKVFRVLFALAMFAALTGLWFLPGAIGPRYVTVTWSIRAGANFFSRWEFDVLSGGSASVTYVAASGAIVRAYVMTQAQHEALLAGQGTGSLAFDERPNGSLSADLPGGGAYFLMFGHGSGYGGVVESGLADVRISAVSTWPFLEALTGILVGVGLGAAGVLLRARARRTAPTAPPEGGVVFFGPPKPPQGPPSG